ncbi:uncharacterized protein L203_104505 [Cryptococcus depauperatus CBS 7841]|uniref:Uncharacterized protein n=1 Tax=Cryptococcus depauperatus CBS 7841 TaxID=1295531 RepID=A0A1E3ILW6_9TREE|nr:hypothetical protein L203_02302 [Cryptococcus depauperatus CBS 7841]ODN93604.1 hypothetical protein L204_04785 [Cryptococcus depauperatus CBS 7855]
MFFHLSAASIIIVIAFFLVCNRARLIPIASRFLPAQLVNNIVHYTPLTSYSFEDQARAGMTSGNFDLEANNGEGSGESRVGLDDAGVEEVRRIMSIERCTFDQARLIRHNRILAKNGIASDGTPLDRKAITHL